MANGKILTNTIDEQRLAQLAQALATFSTAAETLRRQIVALFPAKYGSDLWWEKEEIRADEDIKARRFKEFSSMEEAIKWLDA